MAPGTPAAVETWATLFKMRGVHSSRTRQLRRRQLLLALMALLGCMPLLGVEAVSPASGQGGATAGMPVDFEPPALPGTSGPDAGASLWEAVPASAAVPEASTAAAPDPVETRLRERDAFLREFAVENAVTRTSLQGARSNADRLYDGVAGIPLPLLSDLLPTLSEPTYGLKLGPLRLQPTLGTGFVLNKITGVSARTEEEGNVTGTVAAVLGRPETGRFLTSNYAAAEVFGKQGGQSTRFSQSLALLGEWDLERLKLGMGLTYASLGGPSREFTEGTRRNLATVALTARYLWTEKTSFDLDLTAPISEYASGIGSGGVTATTFVNYAYSPKTTLGLGFASGFLKVENSNTQTFQEVLVRSTLASSPHLLYTATAGADFRDAGGVQAVNPLLALGVTWMPRAGSTVYLTAEQRVQNSAAVTDANFLSSSVTVGLTQRLGSRASFSLALGGERASYQSARTGIEIDREDRTLFAQMGASLEVTARCTATATLSWRRTASEGAAQRILQAGVQLTYRF